MSYIVNDNKLWEMSVRAVVGTTRGCLGILITIAVVIAAFVVSDAINANASSIARMVHARDIDSAQSLGRVAALGLIVVAIATGFSTWKACNSCIGTRLDQSVQIDNGEMLYTFRPFGFFDGRARMIVLVEMDDFALSYDTNIDLMTIDGDIYTAFCRNVVTDFPRSIGEMSRLDSFQIPNCFTPDLYETLALMQEGK